MRAYTKGSYAELIYCMPAPGATLSGSLTRTLISASTSTAPAFKIPAVYLPPDEGTSGRGLRFVARGFYGTTGSPTLTVAAAIDTTAGTFGTAVAATGAYTAETGAGANTVGFELGFDWVYQSAGTAATVQAAGMYTHGTSGNASTAAGASIMVGSATGIAINSTVDNYVEIWATWSVANAANTIVLTQFLVYGLN